MLEQFPVGRESDAARPPEPTTPERRPTPRNSTRARRLAAIGLFGALLLAVFVWVSSDSDGDPPETALTEQRDASTTTPSEKRGTRTTSPTLAVPGVGGAPLASDTTVAGRPFGYGNDPQLDALHDSCEAGNYEACDDLYLRSDQGTEYQSFGNTCGNRNEPGRFCVEIYQQRPAPRVISSYGDDPELDALAERCEAADFGACDELYRVSPFGSEYEQYADTCGGRNDPGLGLCSELYS